MIELFLGCGFCIMGILILLKTRRDAINLAIRLKEEVRRE